MSRLIIGIGYQSRVGKTECGNIFREYLDDFQICSNELNFSDGIKRTAADVFGLNAAQLYGDEKDTVDAYWKIAPRMMFQRIGDMMRDLFGYDVWIKSWSRAVECLDPKLAVVCCDVRLTGEARKIRELGGFLIKVERGSTALRSEHPTEVDLDEWTDWDHTIWNNKAHGKLVTQARSVMEKILKARDLS